MKSCIYMYFYISLANWAYYCHYFLYVVILYFFGFMKPKWNKFSNIMLSDVFYSSMQERLIFCVVFTVPFFCSHSKISRSSMNQLRKKREMSHCQHHHHCHHKSNKKVKIYFQQDHHHCHQQHHIHKYKPTICSILQ